MKRVTALLLCLVLLLGCFPAFTVTAAKYDTVFFGSYYQNRTYDRALKELLQYETTFRNDRATVDGVTFAYKSGAYYPKEPVEWCVLEDDGSTYTLLSKYILEYRPFSSHFWKDSDLRTWMNGELYNELFSAEEKKAVLTTSVETEYQSYEDRYINGQPAHMELTKDKLYLLTEDDVLNSAYGFAPAGDSATRVAYTTSYANYSQPADKWWLRESFWASGNPKQLYVSASGSVSNWYGTYTYGVRPVVRVKKSAVSATRPATALPTVDSYYTSTASVYPAQYESLKESGKFPIFSDSLVGDIVIPGIKQTNMDNTIKGLGKNMVAQGFCIADEHTERPLLLISAYDSKKKKNSVIYAMDANTGSYLTTIVLEGNKSHVGGLAYNPVKHELYIADSSKNVIHVVPYSTLRNAASNGDTTVITLEDSFKVGLTPSFVNYYNGKILVGTHAKTVLSLADSRLYAYDAETRTRIKDFSIMLPLKTQGAQMTYYRGHTYLLCSSSLGRKNSSKLHIYRLSKNHGKYQMSLLGNKKTYTFPHMTEDIHIAGGALYIAFESAAAEYQKKGDACPYPIDRVTIHDLASLLAPLVDDKDPEEVTILSKGRCGSYLYYTLYSSGRMHISGSGSMFQYDDPYRASPWNNFKSLITSVDVEAGVTSIGAKAFANCANLTSLQVGDAADTGDKLVIGDGAFSGCTALANVTIPDMTVAFGNGAFDSAAATRFSSDAASVKSFVKANSGYTLHSHSYTFSKKVSPTCATDGYDIYACACGAQVTRNHKATTVKHSMKLTEQKAATCTTDGYKLYVCTVCGDTMDEELAASHTYVKSTKSKYLAAKATAASAATYYKSCKVCGEKGTSTFKSGKPLVGPALVKVKGVWRYYRSGKIDKSNTLAKRGDKWYHVKGGKIVKDTTLVKYKGTYYYVKNGVRSSANTLVKYKGKWYHVKNGKKVKDTTLVKYKGTYYYVKKGVRTASTTLVKYKNKLYYVKKGKWVKSTAIVSYKGKKYYVKKGIAASTTGVVKVAGKRYSVKKGIVRKTLK